MILHTMCTTIHSPFVSLTHLFLCSLYLWHVTVNQIWHIFRSIAASVSTHRRLVRQLHNQQRIAESQDEWMDLAEQIDNIQGNDIWRTEKKCALYESDRIQARIDELVRLKLFPCLVCIYEYLHLTSSWYGNVAI